MAWRRLHASPDPLAGVRDLHEHGGEASNDEGSEAGGGAVGSGSDDRGRSLGLLGGRSLCLGRTLSLGRRRRRGRSNRSLRRLNLGLRGRHLRLRGNDLGVGGRDNLSMGRRRRDNSLRLRRGRGRGYLGMGGRDNRLRLRGRRRRGHLGVGRGHHSLGLGRRRRRRDLGVRRRHHGLGLRRRRRDLGVRRLHGLGLRRSRRLGLGVGRRRLLRLGLGLRRRSVSLAALVVRRLRVVRGLGWVERAGAVGEGQRGWLGDGDGLIVDADGGRLLSWQSQHGVQHRCLDIGSLTQSECRAMMRRDEGYVPGRRW